MKHYGYEDAVRVIGKAGFDCYDLSMFGMANPSDPLNGDGYMETVRAIKRAAEEVGIACNQTHAPWPSHKRTDEEWNRNIFGWLVRALEITAYLGGKICIVHPWNNWTAEENAENLYLPLLPYCKKYGVKVAVENMFNWPKDAPHALPCACSLPDDFMKHMALLDPEWFVACLDIGHAEMFPDMSSAAEHIYALGERLQCLHVHDNDRHFDLHGIPYTGKVDWESIFAALKEIGYRGDFTFEASAVGKYPKAILPEAEAFLCRIGRYMIERLS